MASTTGAGASRLLLYTAKVCPFAARAELALALAGIRHDTFEVDLLNKPEWYADKVNKASKVPVLVTTDGGDEFKLPESLVIVEYVADLVGADVFFASTAPRFKATSRYLVERYMQLVQPHYFASAVRREAAALAKLRDGLIEFNSLLKSFDDGSNKGAFIQGTDRFGYADLNIAPFVARVLSVSRHGLNPEWEGTPIHQEVEQGADGFERLKRWWEAVQKVEAWNQVWVEDKYIEVLSKGLAAAAAQSASK